MAETGKSRTAEGARACGEEEEEQETVTLQGDSGGFLLQLWERVKGGNSFSDVTLEFRDQKSLPCHSIVLISMSPFFEAALKTEMVEKRKGVIKLPTTSLSTFTLALAYTLGQEVKVKVGRQLPELLELGEMLQLWALTEVVGQLLAHRVTPSSCLETLRLVHKYRLEKVKGEVETFVAGHLDTASQRREWTSMLEEEVSGVIRATRQTSQSADVTAKALLSWLEKNSASPDCASRLLRLIPLDALSDDFLCSALLFHPSVCPCTEFVQTVKKTMLARVSSSGRRSAEASPPSPPLSKFAAMKLPTDDVEIVEEGPTPAALYFFACDRHGNSKTDYMFVWDERDYIWREYPAPPVGYDMCPTLLERDVLLVTSSNNFHSPKVTESKRFSLQRREWTEGNRLNHARINHGVATAFNTAFAVGGVGRDACSVKPIEAYSTMWGEWRDVGFLEVGVRNPGVASVGDLILAVGGQGDSSQSHLIQVFNTVTRTTVIATKLPVMMTFVRFAGKRGGGLYFLSSRGDLVKLVQDGGKFRVDRHVRLDFTPRAHFAVTCERDGVVVYGGTLEFPGEALIRSCGTQAFDYRGRMKESEPRVLPNGVLECQVVPVFDSGALTGWGLQV